MLENPGAETVRHLESVIKEIDNGAVSVIKAGEQELCVCVGPVETLCQIDTAETSEAALIGNSFAAAVERYKTPGFTLKLRKGDLVFGKRTLIMGILNATPDSFSDGGRFHDFDTAVAHGEKMAEEGVDIIDIGGESTRPGSEPVPIEEEAKRVIPVVKHLSENLPIPISIDTCKAEIAERALDAGAEIVNDISSLLFDEKMVGVVSENGCPVILMHMQGTPKVMQEAPYYDALMPEIISFLQNRLDSLVAEGVNPEQVIMDPGIGFGKTVDHNLEILRDLETLKALGRPILVGASRKSTIGKVLDAEADERMEGTAATVAVSIANGAHIVRIHDVKEMVRVAKMTDAIMGKEWN